MKRVCVVLVATALLMFGTVSQAAEDDVAGIVNKSNPAGSLAMTQLQKILLGPRPKWSSGMNITVLMTKPGQPERSATIKIVCAMSETDFMLHFVRSWRKHDGSSNADSGDAPTVISSAVELLRLVASTPNAIGFIKASQVDDSVKVVAIDGSLPGEAAYKLRPK